MSGLEASEETLKVWVQQVLELLQNFPRPSSERITSIEIAESPLEGGFQKILEVLGVAFAEAMPTSLPGYMAYVPGGGIPSSAVASFLANLMNRFTGIEEHAPQLVAYENQMLLWFCREFGLPETAFGVLTTGGSIANLTALVAARNKVIGDTGNFSLARIYVSDQVHHSVRKSAKAAGIPTVNCVSIPSDSNFRMSLPALFDQVKRDQAAGLKPLALVASAGTTSTGSIDPLEELADFCQQENLWFHVDGAYGGAFILCEEGKRRLQGISRADSIAFDPHKSLFLPYGLGCLLIRDRADLLRAYAYEADYLAPSEANSFASLGLELSREYRGIKLWLPLMLHGVSEFRAQLSEKLLLAHGLYEQLQSLPIEFCTRPDLTALVFRLKNNGSAQQLIKRVNSYGRVYLAATRLHGEMVVRICILSFRTHQEQVQACLEDIKRAIYEL